jgi:uncharacterized protein YbjT (DUF2867 family)
MSDERTYTERDVRERERAAFCVGVEYAGLVPGKAAEREAARRFPITRRVPRVVKVVRDGVEWEVKRCNDGFYARSHPSADWTLQSASCTPDNVRALVDLLDNPFDEVTE